MLCCNCPISFLSHRNTKGDFLYRRFFSRKIFFLSRLVRYRLHCVDFHTKNPSVNCPRGHCPRSWPLPVPHNWGRIQSFSVLARKLENLRTCIAECTGSSSESWCSLAEGLVNLAKFVVSGFCHFLKIGNNGVAEDYPDNQNDRSKSNSHFSVCLKCSKLPSLGEMVQVLDLAWFQIWFALARFLGGPSACRNPPYWGSRDNRCLRS